MSRIGTTLLQVSFTSSTCRGVMATARSRLDEDEALLYARGIYRDRDILVLEAPAGQEAEMLLVDRRGDDGLALEIADDAARENVRAGEGIAVADRKHVPQDPEDRDLLAL